jgi:hypothetical protein
MPGAGGYRSLISRLGEITRRAVREPRPRLALKLSIDPGNLVRQPPLGVFLTDWAEPKINGHAAVVFVDDASTVTIDPDTRRTSACHDVPPRLKAEIVGTVMYERKSVAARQRTHAMAEFMPHQRTDSAGNAPQFPEPSASLLAAGSEVAGPAPQIQPPAVGAFGEKKKLCRISPSPEVSMPPATGDCASMSRPASPGMWLCATDSTSPALGRATRVPIRRVGYSSRFACLNQSEAGRMEAAIKKLNATDKRKLLGKSVLRENSCSVDRCEVGTP